VDHQGAKITAGFPGVTRIPEVGRSYNNLLEVLFGCCREKLEFHREILARLK
jgi:hypothetical protein